MKTILRLLFFLTVLVSITTKGVYGQNENVGIGTTSPERSAILDLSSTDKGLLIPRLTLEQKNRITNPAKGLILFQTDEKSGFYYFNGEKWSSLSDVNAVAADPNDWSFGGNVVPTGAFIGTINNEPLIFKVRNQYAGQINQPLRNVYVGIQAGQNNTTGMNNLGLGFGSLMVNTTGESNAGVGTYSLIKNTTGSRNLAIGSSSMQENLSGDNNVAIGFGALRSVASTSSNVAIGAYSGFATTGTGGVFIGSEAGRSETTGGKLYISNSNTVTPLVYGDFSAGFVSIGNVPVAKRNIARDAGTYSLIVEKGILSEKLKVALKSSGDWADYVFEPEYKSNMLTLEEVEAFTIKNKHLPNVPSASELVEKGLDFNETSRMFMEKIEELTLYLIEMNKEIKTLKSENAVLKADKK